MHHCEDFEFPMRFEIGQGRFLTQARGAKDVRALQRSMDSDSESSSDEERGGQHPFYQTIPSIVDAFPTVEFDLTQLIHWMISAIRPHLRTRRVHSCFTREKKLSRGSPFRFLPVDIPIDTPH